jgi:uncharacterized membrane protein
LQQADDDPHMILAPKSAVVAAVDRERLVRAAVEADCVLHLLVPVGTFVPAGAPMVRVEGVTADVVGDQVQRAVALKLERTLDEDVAYGFRMLVDVAERSLADSPFLDPTTAVQAIDRLHDGLRQLATRVIADGDCRDERGRVRVRIPAMCWDDFVHLAFDEIRLAGADSPQVTRRLVAAIEDLLEVAPEERRPPLREQLRLIEDSVRGSSMTDRDIEAALSPDVQGIGVAAGVSADSRA